MYQTSAGMIEFLTLRERAHKLAEDYCNIDMGEEVYAKRESELWDELAAILVVKNAKQRKDMHDIFLVTGDPRGWVLKIDNDKIEEDEAEALRDAGVERDWGGYYCLGYKSV